MKWYGHLLLYLLSCAITELMLIMFFALAAITNGNGEVWANFHIPQIGLPIAGLIVWMFIELAIDYDERQTKEAEWHKEVNEMLKDYKSKKEEER